MGNCWASLFGRAKRSKNYFSGRYKEYNIGVEFENLIEDDHDGDADTVILTETEREHLINKRFSELVRDQSKKDAEIDAQLLQEEENLRLEEEAYNAAKEEAAKITKQARLLEEQKKMKKMANGSAKVSWAGDSSEWNMANEDDDFESYLENVKARSASARATVQSFSNPSPAQSINHSSAFDVQWNSHAGANSPPTGQLNASQTEPGIPPEVQQRRTGLPLSNLDEKQVKEIEQRSKFTEDIDWEGEFVRAEMEEVISADSSGDSAHLVRMQQTLPPITDSSLKSQKSSESIPKTFPQNTLKGTTQSSLLHQELPNQTSKQNNLSKDDTSRTPSSNTRVKTNSFTIDDDSDDEFLDLVNNIEKRAVDIESAKIQVSSSSVGEKVSSNGGERSSYDIDIEKFLEELDAEI